MAEEKIHTHEQVAKSEEYKHAEEKIEHKKPAETSAKTEEKVQKEPKKKEVPKIKKFEAVAYGVSAPISKKHSMYICSFIKHKPIDLAISQLEEVLKFKRAIPFKGEIPHRHELGGKPGRYPQNASRYFIKLLKGLKGNVLVNLMDLDKTRIVLASASWDARPARSGGRSAKRSYIILKAKEMGDKK